MSRRTLRVVRWRMLKGVSPKLGTDLGQLGYRRELDVVAKAIDVRAVVLAAGPQESFPTSEEELSTINKPIARKSRPTGSCN